MLPESSPRLKGFLGLLLAALAFVAYWNSDLRTMGWADYKALGENPSTPFIMIGAMACAWTFAIPASAFYFIVPLLYLPPAATVIVTAGSTLGALTGYIASRTITGPWIERFKKHRVTRFLETHSDFAALLAIRVVPSSPHGFINYGAGIVGVPLARFLLATMVGSAVKAFVYSLSVHAALGATSLTDAVGWKSMGALFGVALLVLGGRYVQRRFFTEEPPSVSIQDGG